MMLLDVNIDIPPERFDHPYNGPVIEQVLSIKEAQKFCTRIAGKAPPDMMYYGCTYKIGDTCFVTLADTQIIYQIRRHEIGHCNGWSNKHEK